MHLVIECLRCERACRDLAAELTNPSDKRALELMASGWARRAAERLRKIEGNAGLFAAEGRAAVLNEEHDQVGTFAHVAGA